MTSARAVTRASSSLILGLVVMTAAPLSVEAQLCSPTPSQYVGQIPCQGSNCAAIDLFRVNTTQCVYTNGSLSVNAVPVYGPDGADPSWKTALDANLIRSETWHAKDAVRNAPQYVSPPTVSPGTDAASTMDDQRPSLDVAATEHLAQTREETVREQIEQLAHSAFSGVAPSSHPPSEPPNEEQDHRAEPSLSMFLLDELGGAIKKIADMTSIFEGGDPVLPTTGEFFIDELDVSVQAVGIDFVLRRIYRSRWSYYGPLGYGWTHSYDQRLTFSETSCGDAFVVTVQAGS